MRAPIAPPPHLHHLPMHQPQLQPITVTQLPSLPSSLSRPIPILWYRSRLSLASPFPILAGEILSLPTIQKQCLTSFRNYGTALIQLMVGSRDHRVIFEIHKQVLCDESIYFRKLFSAKPGLDIHCLPDVDPTAFVFVYKWLYGDRKSISQFIVVGRANCEAKGIRAMIELYFMAYHLHITPLEDLAMELLGNGYYRSDLYPTNEDIEHAYTKTEPGSALRQYMARQFQQRILTSIAGPPLDELHNLLRRHPELAMDFVLQSRGVLKNGLWRTETLMVCDFHAHPRGAPCPTRRLTFSSIDYAYGTGRCGVDGI
jgi:BTB/POZ domain